MKQVYWEDLWNYPSKAIESIPIPQSAGRMFCGLFGFWFLAVPGIKGSASHMQTKWSIANYIPSLEGKFPHLSHSEK